MRAIAIITPCTLCLAAALASCQSIAPYTSSPPVAVDAAPPDVTPPDTTLPGEATQPPDTTRIDGALPPDADRDDRGFADHRIRNDSVLPVTSDGSPIVCQSNAQCGGLTCCKSRCVDTQTDANNCGGCAVPCSPGQPVCCGGRCWGTFPPC